MLPRRALLRRRMSSNQNLYDTLTLALPTNMANPSTHKKNNKRDVVITPPNAHATQLKLPPTNQPQNAHTLTCCLIGPTNAGKSTLLNCLIDQHVSITSDKIHTTRQNTIGFLTDEQHAAQVEFIDAPGALGPDVPILRRAVWEAVRAADLALVVVDASDAKSERQVGSFLGELAAELSDQEKSLGKRAQTVLILNKSDRVGDRSRLLGVSARLHNAEPRNRFSKKIKLPRHTFDWPTLTVSAKTGYGVRQLRQWLLTMSRPGEWRVAAGVVHMQPPLQIATEIIRAHIFRCFREELPYVLGQRNIGWTELSNGDLRIDQSIIVPAKRKSTRAIVENRLAMVGSAARVDIAAALERRVHLFLSVGTSKGLGDDLGPDADVIQ